MTKKILFFFERFGYVLKRGLLLVVMEILCVNVSTACFISIEAFPWYSRNYNLPCWRFLGSSSCGPWRAHHMWCRFRPSSCMESCIDQVVGLRKSLQCAQQDRTCSLLGGILQNHLLPFLVPLAVQVVLGLQNLLQIRKSFLTNTFS